MLTRVLFAAASVASLASAAASVTAAPAATDIAGALSTLLPTAPPATTEVTTATDNSSGQSLASICQSDLLAAFFLHAAPSGDLASALTSFGSVLTSQACAAATIPSATAATACPSPAPSLWCAFPDAAPSSVLASYTSYGQAAASYLPSGLSPLVALATECPQAWYGAKTMFADRGADNLRDLAIFGECFATARTGVVATTGTTSGTGSTATTGTGTAKSSGTATGSATGGAAKPSGSSSGADRAAMANTVTLAAVAATVVCLTLAVLL